MATRRKAIRDVRVAAPLKRQQRDRETRHGLVYPRRTRRGPVEALMPFAGPD